MASSISKEGTAHIPLWLLWYTVNERSHCHQGFSNTPPDDLIFQTRDGTANDFPSTLLIFYCVCLKSQAPYLFAGFGLGLLTPFDSWRSHAWSGDVLVWGSGHVLLVFERFPTLLLSAEFCFWLALVQFRFCSSVLVIFILRCSTVSVTALSSAILWGETLGSTIYVDAKWDKQSS